MKARRFPWGMLLALWTILSALLAAMFWKTSLTLDFNDPDDFLRLQQVRDFLAGQSWFDLTQHRMGAPVGLPMHWSRLVDIPILLFMMPLKPLLGDHLAEVAAIIGAPLLTLLGLMVALAVIIRRLLGLDRSTLALAFLLIISAVAVMLQIHPARIDHHGWQIVFAAMAVASLLQRNARQSGIWAGVALALYLNISIEGVPFVAAVIGIVALLWVLRREPGNRLTAMLWTLAAVSLLSTLLLAPSYRWHEQLCDAIMPSHLVMFGVAAIATDIAVRVGATHNMAVRTILLVCGGALSLAAFGLEAPQCLGSPFGRMDPVVANFWYDNVVEGMPLWRQEPVAGASMIVFPIIGTAGTLLAWQRAKSLEAQRRWSIMLALALATLLTGTLVCRAAGVAHVVAMPGALFLIGTIIRFAEARLTVFAKVPTAALAIVLLSPLMPIVVAAAVTPTPPAPLQSLHRTDVRACDRLCALKSIGRLPPQTLLAGIDLGPIVIATTPHSVYGSGYHRLANSMRETILFFYRPPNQGEAFMRRHGFRRILIAPSWPETQLFLKRAPHGTMAHLINGPTPDWLVEEPTGSPIMRLYRLRD